jgi:hypothetical protein
MDEEAAALTASTTRNDRYPFLERVRAEGDPREAQTRTVPRALVVAEDARRLR